MYDTDMGFSDSYNPYQQSMQYAGMGPSFLTNLAQPSRPTRGQMFRGGLKNNPGSGFLSSVMGGLSGFAGSGGVMGGLGRAAHFLI